ncbi:asparagine synthase (glutamine-hydrolyzing) [Streptomyces sp. Ru87]|uniref:asparagine synthase (glutamine-hydrolyzing) n=2 Tax=unclassified Streptomyces TaxID=2593676 RepID=UPI000BF7D2C5|nr:asparagine synthase (glutamine-hydrolyzing) [Streptomyces sp. Ru87]PGH51975.1 asparagine synthase (glutamine-hydrolyzing) [Streptomyces sp. Ru87]
MCGICGAVGERRGKGGDAVAAMLDAMTHRGPDSRGAAVADGVALGACRLAVIGPEAASQPLRSACTDLTLVVNGEIYNHVELRRELEARGHRFTTGGDCEVILHLYEDEGLDALKRLRGMFALALLDPAERRLLLARDRMGEKPLYLAETPDGWCFASEMTALLRSGLVPLEIDHGSLREYLHYQYVPEPATLLAGVRQLPAGSWLDLDLDTGKSRTGVYWDLEAAPALPGDPAAVLEAGLRDIGRIVVRSDAPIAVALSGGLDSTIVASLAAANAPGVTAVGVGYAGRPAIDERRHATRAAAALGVRLTHVELSPADVAEDFDALVQALDHPVADLAGPAYHAVAKAAHDEGCRVLLLGHGGDELFWGYRWVHTARAALAGHDPARVTRGLLYRHMEVVRDSARLLPGLCSPDWPHRLPDDDGSGPGSGPDTGTTLPVRLTRLLADTYLRSNGVAQTERLCMAHSVETRLPLLDHRFVDLVTGLRKHARDDALPAKDRLRAAAAPLIPGFVAGKPKTPFYTPTRDWHAALFAAHGDRVADGWLRSAGVLSPAGAVRAARGRTGVGSGTSLSYKALMFETWYAALRAAHRPPGGGAPRGGPAENGSPKNATTDHGQKTG